MMPLIYLRAYAMHYAAERHAESYDDDTRLRRFSPAYAAAAADIRVYYARRRY